MTVALQFAVALASVGALLAVMAAVHHMAKRWDIHAEVQRKLVHMCTGLYALVLPWIFPAKWPVYVLVILTLLIMLVLRLPNSRLGATLHGVERQSYGDFLLAISVGLCLFLSGDYPYLYVLPLAVLTLADAAAALAGSTYGTRFFHVENGQKSIEGSVVFFILTLLISIICMMFMTPFPPISILLLSLMVAGFGTFIEASSWRGYDNLFLPMGLLIFLAVHSDSNVSHLLLLIGLFVGCILILKHYAPRIGLSPHAARVYVTTVFLILAVTDVQNALAPILVLATNVWSRLCAPCDSDFAELEIIIGLAVISFGWLVVGEGLGWNAVSFYGITASAMAMSLSALAVASRPLKQRILPVLRILLVICALRVVAFYFNDPFANWNGEMWHVLGLSLLLTMIVPMQYPAQFSKHRVAKVTLLSLLVPLFSYAMALGIFRGILG